MNRKILARIDKENNKGFTLVELIVVLVILAILAAILVPALLGWIDKAKEKQILLDARDAYMAAQAVISEDYAKQSPIIPDGTINIDQNMPVLLINLISEIEELAGLSESADIAWIDVVDHRVVGLAYADEDAELAAILKDGDWEIQPYLTDSE